ncbi:MAG: hypothetical protein JOZ95_08865 [Solirubrobacterales bacterium]|nr:hypothetical protein [Solirubrobacterales bacterium]
MRFRPSPEELQATQITRLVDDPAADTASSEGGTWAERPEIRRQIAAQRRVAQELRVGGPDVPAGLVGSVEAKVRQAYGPRAAGSRRATPGWRPAVAVAGLAAVCAAIVIAAVGAGGSRPSIPAAAALAFAPSTGPAPAARSATYLDASYGGVTYPNYQKFSVPPTGTRTDRIGGRPALTVFYRLPNGTRLSYTVFSGRAVPPPAGTKNVVFAGVPLKTFSTSSGLSVVTLVRYGRTCVLAAKVKPNVVLGLAAAPVLAQARA